MTTFAPLRLPFGNNSVECAKQILAEIGITDTLNSGATTARRLAESWDNQWLDLLQNNTNNNLYGALTNLGVFFAVGTLLFFMMQWLKDVIHSE
jgi:hypothetical protein